MRKELALISSKEASNRLNVPELALGQLAMDRKFTIHDSFQFCEKEIKKLSLTDLSRYR